MKFHVKQTKLIAALFSNKLYLPESFTIFDYFHERMIFVITFYIGYSALNVFFGGVSIKTKYWISFTFVVSFFNLAFQVGKGYK